MTHTSTIRALIRATAVLSLCGALDFTPGCDAVDAINGAIDQFDKARQDAVAQSNAWRTALPKLVQQLDLLEGQAAADAKGVITDAKNQVQELVTDSLSFANVTMQEGIAKAGVEARCTTDSITAGVSAKLQYLVDDLKFWQTTKHHLDKKPVHGLCQIVGDTLSLHSSGHNQFTLNSTKLIGTNIVGVFGYNFRPDALPHLAILNAQAKLIRELAIFPAYVSQYQLTLDFTPETFAGAEPGGRIRLVWPDGGDPNEISLSVVAPAKLAIVEHQFTPSASVMMRDAVQLAVTVRNNGGERSPDFHLQWTPAGGRPQSVGELALNPGESRRVKFPNPYTYQTEGRARNDVSITTGDDAQVFWIDVSSNIASVTRYVIDKPPVKDPWTATLYRVKAGDKVEVVDAGGCVNTGGAGRTTKRYLDPKNTDCGDDDKYYGTIAIPGTIEQTERRKIQTFMTHGGVVATRDAMIYLGYVDDGYGDNGYWGMDDHGTCDQCRNAGNAHLTIVVTHYK